MQWCHNKYIRTIEKECFIMPQEEHVVLIQMNIKIN